MTRRRTCETEQQTKKILSRHDTDIELSTDSAQPWGTDPTAGLDIISPLLVGWATFLYAWEFPCALRLKVKDS